MCETLHTSSLHLSIFVLLPLPPLYSNHASRAQKQTQSQPDFLSQYCIGEKMDPVFEQDVVTEEEKMALDQV